MIPNPTPITATFNGMWISDARITMLEGKVDAKLQGYDPNTKHLLATGNKNVYRKVIAPQLLDDIVSNLQRIAGRNADVRLVHVIAPDPNKNVAISVMFAEGTPYILRDAFALAETDQAFAEVFTEAMEFIAA